jgi:hypothetical protein
MRQQANKSAIVNGVLIKDVLAKDSEPSPTERFENTKTYKP